MPPAASALSPGGQALLLRVPVPHPHRGSKPPAEYVYWFREHRLERLPAGEEGWYWLDARTLFRGAGEDTWLEWAPVPEPERVSCFRPPFPPQPVRYSTACHAIDGRGGVAVPWIQVGHPRKAWRHGFAVWASPSEPPRMIEAEGVRGSDLVGLLDKQLLIESPARGRVERWPTQGPNGPTALLSGHHACVQPLGQAWVLVGETRPPPYGPLGLEFVCLRVVEVDSGRELWNWRARLHIYSVALSADARWVLLSWQDWERRVAGVTLLDTNRWVSRDVQSADRHYAYSVLGWTPRGVAFARWPLAELESPSRWELVCANAEALSAKGQLKGLEVLLRAQARRRVAETAKPPQRAG